MRMICAAFLTIVVLTAMAMDGCRNNKSAAAPPAPQSKTVAE